MILATPGGPIVVTDLYAANGDVVESFEKACQVVGTVVDGPDEGATLTAPVEAVRIIPLN